MARPATADSLLHDPGEIDLMLAAEHAGIASAVGDGMRFEVLMNMEGQGV
jgi:hypothetical protein